MSERVGRGEPERRGRPLMEHVPAALAGERVDRVVALLADVSRSVAVAVIADGGVRVDGAVATSGKVRLAEGALVEIDGAAIPVDAPPQADAEVGFTVVHEDDDVIVVDKPAGLVVHPGPGRREGTLVNGLLHRYPELARVGDDPARPGIVHRLDAGSSGLLVVARTAVAREALIGQFAAHTARRRYDAVVWGHPEAARGIIDAPVGRDRADPLRMAVVVDGKKARTAYEVVATFDSPGSVARLTCRLETGRTHQIRVHLAAVGHPLVGDPTYGDRRTTFGLARPFLHAVELTFVHPGDGASMTFRSPLAADLAAFLATLS